jgi:ubiquinone/menaquinone biosynthesis C-methylase UbiE
VNLNKALWEKGDFTKIAGFMRQSGEAFVKSLQITPPLRVLDLGCGDGTTAVPLAVLGAEVVGIDIAENLVAAGNRRAAEAGLDRLKFQQGDACDLQGIGDHSFDLTLSMFGAMFAPKPVEVAKEMVRVTKPSRSKLRSVCVNIFCEMPVMIRCNSLKRRGLSCRKTITKTVYLSAIRSRAWRVGQFLSYTSCILILVSIR